MGISRYMVCKYLKRCGVTTEKIFNQFDDGFFNKDTEESFYWAGFIAADGCVLASNNKKSADPDMVSKCCRGVCKSHRGFTWRYA